LCIKKILKKNPLNNCKKCESKFSGNYCPNCGNPISLTRINGQYILKEIGSVLNFDKGILYTIKELLLRPGVNIRKFIQEDRNRLVKPIIFLILCSLIYTLAEQLFHFEEAYVKADFGDSAVSKIFDWIKSNYGYSNIFMGFFIGLWTKILFKKSGYNIYEILILIFFIMGIGMLIYGVFGIAESLTKLKVLHIGGIIGIVYSIWAIGCFFDKQKVSNYIKGFFSYFLGLLSSTIMIVAIGLLIDLITK
jgi:hypothetical protein